MAENMRTADYTQPDEAVAVGMLFMQKTTAELNAMQTARTIGIGTLYYDTTTTTFKIGVNPTSVSASVLINPAAVAITGGTINGTSVGATTPGAGSFTTLQNNSSRITSAAARAVNTTAALAAVTIGASIQSTYLATPAAAIAVTLAAPVGDGERRKITFGAATTVTWTPTAPATSVTPLKTTFAAGEEYEVVYNSVAGTPANSAATTWYPF